MARGRSMIRAGSAGRSRTRSRSRAPTITNTIATIAAPLIASGVEKL